MNFNIDRFFASFTVISTGLAGFAAPALATTSLTNPCPRIYYSDLF